MSASEPAPAGSPPPRGGVETTALPPAEVPSAADAANETLDAAARPGGWGAEPPGARAPRPRRGPIPERWFDLSDHSSLGSLLEETARRGGRRPALTLSDRGRAVRRLDHAGFRAEALAVARGLAARGVGPGDRVALLSANGPEWLAGAAAVFHLGGVLVPLDPKLEAQEQARLVEHAGAATLLCDGPAWRRLERLRLPSGLERVVVHDPLGPLDGIALPRAELLAGKGPPPPLAPRDRGDVASIVYSSGTTGGAPKGCLLTHGNYLSQAEVLGNLYPLREDEVYLSVLPTHHALDFMCGFLVPFLCSAQVVHLRTLRPEFLLGALRDHRVTHMAAVPALLRALERRLRERLDGLPPLADAGLRGLVRLNRALTRRRPREALSRALLRPVHDALGGRLRRIFAGGAFVPPATARYLYELGFPVAIGYGLTEACAVVSVNDLAPFRDDTVGLPVPGTEVRIAGRDAHGRGEVWVRGPQVFAGYLDDPEATAAALDDGWLRTGDLGELDATGHLRLVGRLKNVVVTAGGKNVSPESVEARFHGIGVEELCVLAAHRVWESAPGDDEALLLCVRPRPGEELPREELARRNRRLPAHQRAAGLVTLSAAFPRTTSLKLRRDLLAARVRALGRGAVEPL